MFTILFVIRTDSFFKSLSRSFISSRGAQPFIQSPSTPHLLPQHYDQGAETRDAPLKASLVLPMDMSPHSDTNSTVSSPLSSPGNGVCQGWAFALCPGTNNFEPFFLSSTHSFSFCFFLTDVFILDSTTLLHPGWQVRAKRRPTVHLEPTLRAQSLHKLGQHRGALAESCTRRCKLSV